MQPACDLQTAPDGVTTQEFLAILVDNNGCARLNTLKLKALQFWARGISQ